MKTLEQFMKLDRDAMIAAYAEAISVTTDPALKPYELPSMTADSAGLITDGVTPNKDGSIWAVVPAMQDRNGNQIQAAGPTRKVYGYYSRRKNPRLFGPVATAYGWDHMVKEWDSDPWMLHAGNPEDYLDQGYVLPGDPRRVSEGKTEITFMMASYMVTPLWLYKQ